MILKLVIKTGIVGGVVYYTKQLGVWGTSKQTEKLYCDISKSLQPVMKQAKGKLPFEVPPLPKTGEVRFLAKHYYNQGVKSSINFIYMLPCYTGRLVKKGKDALSQAMDTSSGTTAK